MQKFLKGKLKCGLYVVATPIGNLEDITFRAVETLKDSDLIICEDTRVTGKLLQKFEIKNSMKIYNDNSSENVREKVLEMLGEGMAIALVSDAGTPLISDPGYKLVRECRDKGVDVVPVGGISAVTTALSVCGLPTNRFMFCGFLSAKKGERIKKLSELMKISATLVFYESPHRLVKLLSDVEEVFGGANCVVLRELTKLHEEVKSGSVEELINYYSEKTVKGEIVVIVNNNKIEKKFNKMKLINIEKELKKALKTMSKKDAVDFVARELGVNRKVVYKVALDLG
jgi:16S rRNA (cytidine1402-2'-O)-methyltransferase